MIVVAVIIWLLSLWFCGSTDIVTIAELLSALPSFTLNIKVFRAGNFIRRICDGTVFLVYWTGTPLEGNTTIDAVNLSFDWIGCQ